MDQNYFKIINVPQYTFYSIFPLSFYNARLDTFNFYYYERLYMNTKETMWMTVFVWKI